MGRVFVTHLEGKFYSCKHCRTHLALCQDIVSKSFHCRHGKAYLFSKVVNVSLGENEERQMMTGWHTVADIFCVGCGSIVGWKYETAHEKTQKYKEGKSVLERDVVTVWIPVLREIGNMTKIQHSYLVFVAHLCIFYRETLAKDSLPMTKCDGNRRCSLFR
ncbi:protein yippee-like isoform X1 [Arachis stenosperma]|uniref:protein yippee-like isoform X1 n=1 Tax=Arachis stenosperma TaxID=217475 RepID=UPI0025AC8DD3|nr:protein yippee-like isoform X1 [Arachis stenosperma]